MVQVYEILKRVKMKINFKLNKIFKKFLLIFFLLLLKTLIYFVFKIYFNKKKIFIFYNTKKYFNIFLEIYFLFHLSNLN